MWAASWCWCRWSRRRVRCMVRRACGIVRRIVRSLCFAGACVRTRSIALARDSVARSRDPVARTVVDHTGCEAGVGLVVVVACVLATRTVMHGIGRTHHALVCSSCRRVKSVFEEHLSRLGCVYAWLTVSRQQNACKTRFDQICAKGMQKGHLWALIAIRSCCKSVAYQLLRTGSAGHGASRRVRSERAASRTARAEPSRRVCNGYNSQSAPSSVDASKITVPMDHAQCTQMGLGAHPFGLGLCSCAPANHPPPVRCAARTWESS